MKLRGLIWYPESCVVWNGASYSPQKQTDWLSAAWYITEPDWTQNRILTRTLIPVAARSKACGSAAARLLGLRVRILPGAWMSVYCECCVLSGGGLYWFWLWSCDNEEALARWAMLRHEKWSQEHLSIFSEPSTTLRHQTRNHNIHLYLWGGWLVLWHLERIIFEVMLVEMRVSRELLCSSIAVV